MTYPQNLFKGFCIHTEIQNKQLTFIQAVGVVLFTTLVLVLFV